MKTALVTGSSRGIGRAIAVRLTRDGYKVIVQGAGNITKDEETKKSLNKMVESPLLRLPIYAILRKLKH